MKTYAKTRIVDEKPRLGQTVLEHCIAVGEVAKLLAKLRKFDELPLNEIGLIWAMHDIGKITPGFQWKIQNAVDPIEARRLFPTVKADDEKEYAFHSGAAKLILENEFNRYSDAISDHSTVICMWTDGTTKSFKVNH